MKIRIQKVFAALPLLAVLSILSSRHATAFAQGTAFTYQGRLTEGGNPANGNYDLTFGLYDTVSGGNIVAAPITNLAVAVNSGLFTVTLDFGSAAFTGSPLWLKIGVRTN